jgi:nucleoside-diphosphate-sugar epimerase
MTQKNKILIFGGAGFIGHHLVNLLQSKHDICVYDNFNIFGITHERIKNQIIQDQHDADENTLCAPINLYGSLKLSQEYLLKSNAKNKNFSYIIFRPICVFGNNDIGDRLVSKFIKSAITGQEIFYAQDTFTDITYVDDFVTSIDLAIDSDVTNETFNISGEHSLSIKQLAETIKQHYDSKSTLVPVNREKYFPNRGSLNIQKIKNLLGYKRKFDFFQALEKIDEYSIY